MNIVWYVYGVCDPIVVVNYELQRPPSLNLQTCSNTLALLTLLGLVGDEMVPIGGHSPRGKSFNSYPVGVRVKLNVVWGVSSLFDCV